MSYPHEGWQDGVEAPQRPMPAPWAKWEAEQAARRAASPDAPWNRPTIAELAAQTAAFVEPPRRR
jgi:hypothetical protein